MIGIVGAGISGLSLAWKLKQKNIPFTIFDNKPGGLISSQKQHEFLLENGPNSLIFSEELEELIRESGFENQVIYPSDGAKKRFILFKGKPVALPSGPLSLLMNPLFSWKSILNLWKERNIHTKSNENETVADFFDRRFGKEIRENLVNPFVSGIYAGTPEKMLVSLSFPKLVEMEKNYRSVIRGFMKSKTKQKTINFINGIGSFIEHLQKKLDEHLINEKIEKIEKSENQWLLNDKYKCRTIVLCNPAYQISQLLKTLFPTIASNLKSIYYPPIAQVYLGFRDEVLFQQTQGFGLLSPAFEKSFCLGLLFSSQLFENRAPQNTQLITAFIGGSRNPEYALLPESEIIKRVTSEIQKIYLSKSEPIFSDIKVYPQAIPQPDLHMKVAREICKSGTENIYFAGNWMSGVAVSECIAYSFGLAEKIKTQTL